MANMYVPAMQYTSESDAGVLFVDFGPVAAADADAIADGVDIATAGTSVNFTGTVPDVVSPNPFGTNVTVVASGAATSTVTVRGWDYYGQPMLETLTLNGATPVAGKKAFMQVLNYSFGATAATTIDIGWGTQLGLPYKCVKVLSEEEDGTPKSTLGTLTAPVLTDPATATTGDPRGTYVPNTTVNGVKHVTARIFIDNGINASGNGGLMGVKHYFA
jgi:hypothetical protein